MWAACKQVETLRILLRAYPATIVLAKQGAIKTGRFRCYLVTLLDWWLRSLCAGSLVCLLVCVCVCARARACVCMLLPKLFSLFECGRALFEWAFFCCFFSPLFFPLFFPLRILSISYLYDVWCFAMFIFLSKGFPNRDNKVVLFCIVLYYYQLIDISHFVSSNELYLLITSH